jgi:hypothetical protein
VSEWSPEQIRELLNSIYRMDSGRILATLIRLLGDFDTAEDPMHEGFAAALSLWPKSGVPGNPRPWLISTARFKGIDILRRRARFDASEEDLARYLEAQSSSAETSEEDENIEDDRLRLIFTCCHPSLQPEASVAPGARSHWPAFPDAAAGVPSRREEIADRRAHPVGKSGSFALEPRADRRGIGPGGDGLEIPPVRALHAAGCDCGRSWGGGIGRGYGLAANRCAL